MAERVGAVDATAPRWPDAVALGASGRALLLLPSRVHIIAPRAPQQAPPVALPPPGGSARSEWRALAAAASARAWVAVDTEGRVARGEEGAASASLVALPEGAHAACAAWAEDERTVAVGTEAGVALLGAGGAVAALAAPPVAALAWRGADLALAHPLARLSLARHAPGAPLAVVCTSPPLLPLPAPSLGLLRWHPTAPLVAAAACTDLLIARLTPHAASVAHLVAAAHTAPLTGVQWLAGGDALCTTALDGALRLWRCTDAECAPLATVLAPSERAAWGVALAPLGTHALVAAAQPPDVRRGMYGARSTATHVLAARLPLPPSLSVPARPAAVAWEVALLAPDQARALAHAPLAAPAASPVAAAQLRALLHARAGDAAAAHAARHTARQLVWEALLRALDPGRALSDAERLSVQLIAQRLSVPPPLALPAPPAPEPCTFCAAPVASSLEDETACARGHRLVRCMRSALLLAPSGNLHCAACNAYARPLDAPSVPVQPFFASLLAAFPDCAFCAAPLQ